MSDSSRLHDYLIKLLGQGKLVTVPLVDLENTNTKNKKAESRDSAFYVRNFLHLRSESQSEAYSDKP